MRGAVARPENEPFTPVAAGERAVPLEGLEPPTLSLGRNCSSIELQRLTGRFY